MAAQRREPRLVEYDLGGGWKALVGKSGADNELLSLRLARPDDWWFHVRGVPGSHVVLRSPDGGEASRALLERAAALAAFHSKARAGGVVSVSCTRARDVSKPKGAPLGTVQIRRERVLKVRPAAPEPAKTAQD